MKKIVAQNPENTKNYLKPDNMKALLITTGIKCILATAGTFFMRTGEYPGLALVLLHILMFAFVYDICCLFQVSLHIAQSYLIAFLLFIVLLLGCVFIFENFFAFLAAIDPATETGQNISMVVMILIFLIPFLIDIVRLIRMYISNQKKAPKKGA
jgi:uncharacterized membrane protein